jgi:hypothetical protein
MAVKYFINNLKKKKIWRKLLLLLNSPEFTQHDTAQHSTQRSTAPKEDI